MRRVLTVLVALALAGCMGSAKVSGRGSFPRDTSPYEFHRSLALTLLKTEQAGQAIPHVRALQELRPKDPEAFYLMGRAYMLLGVQRSAREMLDRALVLDPGLAAAHGAIGVLADAAGDHVAAEKAHRTAIALAPGSPTYHNNLGFCLYLQGRFVESAAAYEKALALDAGARRVHNNAGFAYGRLGDQGSADAHFRLAGTPGQAENNLGLVAEARGELEQALARYQAALLADPKLEEARQNLARVSEALGRPASQGAEP